MRMICKALPLLLTLNLTIAVSTTTSASAQNGVKAKERIAVLGLENRTGVKEDELNYLTQVLREIGSKLPRERYSVVTKDNILVMLPPGRQLEDCLGSCAVETGRNVGADWILVGSMVRFGSSLRLTVNLHHTASGDLRGSKRIKGKTIEDLEEPLERAALRLFAEVDRGGSKESLQLRFSRSELAKVGPVTNTGHDLRCPLRKCLYNTMSFMTNIMAS